MVREKTKQKGAFHDAEVAIKKELRSWAPVALKGRDRILNQDLEVSESCSEHVQNHTLCEYINITKNLQLFPSEWESQVLSD